MQLLLDVGSTTIKRMIVDQERIVDRAEATPPSNCATIAGRYEMDGEALFQEVLRMLEAGVSRETEELLLSTQMHGFILTDELGRPLTPFVTWQDQAALERHDGKNTLEALADAVPQEALLLAGVPLKENLGLVSLAARMRAGMAVPEGALFHSLGGYLIYRLCGRHVCHLTNAGPCGIADVLGTRLNQRLIEGAGLSGLRYPRLLTGYVSCGSAVVAGHELAIFPDLGDQQLCFLGTPCRLDRGYHINVGTAGLAGMLTGQFEAGLYENRAWMEKNTYLRTVSGLPGGRSVAALHARIVARGMEEEAAWHLMTNARGEPRQLAWRAGELLPWLPADMSSEGWCVSLYAAMAERYRQAAEQMHCPAQELYFSGGCVLKNPALRRALEAAFPGARVYLCGVERGAVALARKAQIGRKEGIRNE